MEAETETDRNSPGPMKRVRMWFWTSRREKIERDLRRSASYCKKGQEELEDRNLVERGLPLPYHSFREKCLMMRTATLYSARQILRGFRRHHGTVHTGNSSIGADGAGMQVGGRYDNKGAEGDDG